MRKKRLQVLFSTIKEITDYIEETQYIYSNLIIPIPKGEITTKEDLRTATPFIGCSISTTSGTTGQPVTVPKSKITDIWFHATNIREIKWRNWNMDLTIATILARDKEEKICNNIYHLPLDTMTNLQKRLEEIQPHYLFTYPSIIKELNLSKLTNLIDIKSTGEPGGTNYSCEEAGTIALQCLEGNYHIMENILVESDSVHGILITDLINPIINRYILGDMIELGDKNEICECKRTLPIIKKIYGRTRNMLLLPNGEKIWPTIGEPQFSIVTTKILKHQAVQTSLYSVKLKLMVLLPLTQFEENELLKLIKQNLCQSHIEIIIEYVDSFPIGKFEAFRCEM